MRDESLTKHLETDTCIHPSFPDILSLGEKAFHRSSVHHASQADRLPARGILSPQYALYTPFFEIEKQAEIACEYYTDPL